MELEIIWYGRANRLKSGDSKKHSQQEAPQLIKSKRHFALVRYSTNVSVILLIESDDLGRKKVRLAFAANEL